MCHLISAVITKSSMYSLTCDSHSEIIRHYDLRYQEQRGDLVNVEYRPPDGNIFSTNLSNWIFYATPQLLPEWFSKAYYIEQMESLLLKRRKDFVHDSLTSLILIEDGETHHVRDSMVILHKGFVHVYGHSSVLATEESAVEVSGSGNYIIAQDNTKVITRKIGQNNVICLKGAARLSLSDKSVLYSNIIVVAEGISTVEDWSYDEMGDDPKIFLREQTTGKIFNKVRNKVHNQVDNITKNYIVEGQASLITQN